MNRHRPNSTDPDDLLAAGDPLLDVDVEGLMRRSNAPDRALATMLGHGGPPSRSARVRAWWERFGDGRRRLAFVGAMAAMVAVGIVTIGPRTTADRASTDEVEQAAPAPDSTVEPPVLEISTTTTAPTAPTDPAATDTDPDPDTADGADDPAETSTTVASTASTDPVEVTGPPTSDDGPCTAEGPSVLAARAAYDESCEQPRVDCDELDGTWVCSSEQIGRAEGRGSERP